MAFHHSPCTRQFGQDGRPIFHDGSDGEAEIIEAIDGFIYGSAKYPPVTCPAHSNKCPIRVPWPRSW